MYTRRSFGVYTQRREIERSRRKREREKKKKQFSRAPEVHRKRPLDLTRLKFGREPDNHTFLIPPITRCSKLLGSSYPEGNSGREPTFR